MHPGRNDACPCGSGTKYKKCCVDKGVDWANLSPDQHFRLLSIRGKNIAFINHLVSVLGIDRDSFQPKDRDEFIARLKASITPEAVYRIHAFLPRLWPDINELLRSYDLVRESSSGLYIGSYLYDPILRVLNRHALYNERIILIDPFIDPRRVKAEFSPLERPEEHITTTFSHVLVWFHLVPWIEQGIVSVVRSLGDFDHALNRRCWMIAESRYRSHEVLKRAMEERDEESAAREFFFDQLVHGYPEEYWIAKFQKDDPTAEADQIRAILKDWREKSPYYVDVGRKPQLLTWTTGANYELGKYIAERTNSHLITDLKYRWAEMEVDRKDNGITIGPWTAFAKAFQAVEVKHLDGVSYDDLLLLRKENFLDSLRSFLMRVWKSSAGALDDLSKGTVETLGAELQHQIALSEKEWREIDRNVLKRFATEGVFGAAASVVSGSAAWAPAVAVAAAGAVNLYQAHQQRKDFVKYFPAGFLIESVRRNL